MGVRVLTVRRGELGGYFPPGCPGNPKGGGHAPPAAGVWGEQPHDIGFRQVGLGAKPRYIINYLRDGECAIGMFKTGSIGRARRAL
ncbi:MAG: hypothetical protein MCM46_19725 [Candidatus Manganitrophus sp. SB1]|nr:hypothetical protein [Candidatus Manganitrophus morganii]